MSEKITKKVWPYIRIGAGVLLFVLAPAFSYVLFETVTGNLTTIAPELAEWNIWWMLMFYLAFFVLTGSSRLAVLVVSLFFFLLSLAETFVVSFRGVPIMAGDVLAVRTAMTVAGNYEFRISQEMWEAGRALAVWNLLVWFFPVRMKGWKKRVVLGIGGTGAIAGFVMQFYTKTVPEQGLEINMWQLNDTYEQYGYILSTAISFRYILEKPPAGYSLARMRDICGRITEEREKEERENGEKEEEQERIQPVNLICIMNESLADLKTAGEFTTNKPYFPYLDSLTENTVKGSLCVPVFGAMTCNTEFEFLTGDSMAILPSAVSAYQFYVKPGITSLVSTLKDQGYYAVAMHPYPKENWNRDVCYENFGFDEFLDVESYLDSEQLRIYVSDQADYQKIMERIEEKENPEDKMFIFNVTMQNHGGYDMRYDNFQQEIALTGSCAGKYPRTDQYLSLMKQSDDALAGLLEYFSGVEEPTMIVIFGDHQPGVEDEFYDEIAGMPSTEVEDPDRLMWYQTPFLIWTNYSQPSRDMGKLGAVYLSSHILELANLEMPPYNRFLYQMSQVLPVLHPIGFYEKDDTYYSWEEARSEQCPYQEFVADYECMAYNHSMDSRTVMELFTVP